MVDDRFDEETKRLDPSQRRRGSNQDWCRTYTGLKAHGCQRSEGGRGQQCMAISTTRLKVASGGDCNAHAVQHGIDVQAG